MKTKSIYSIIVALIILMSLSFMTVSMAQSPNKMTYQSVIRNTTGNLIANQAVGIKISILQGSPGGTVVFAETFTPTTNANGLVSLEIGSGTLISGSIATIDWSIAPYFLKTEVDPAGGTTYTISSVTQFLSVPYALYSAKAGATAGTAGGDLNGSYPNPTVVGIQSKPVSVTAPAIDQVLVWDGVNWTPGAKVTGPASGDLSGTYPGPTVAQLQTRPVSAAVPATNDALVWNGSAWAPIANVSGAAGGDLSGSYPNPVVVGIQSKPVAATAPLLNDVYQYNGAQWAPVASSGLGTNYWTLNGTSQIYNNNAGGLVGIGTNAPANKLDVVQAGTVSAGKFSNTNAANSASTVSITTNGTSATALSVSGPGIWGSAIGITNTASGMEWRTSVNGSNYYVTKTTGATFSPVQLFSTGGLDFSNTAGTSIERLLENGNVGIGTTTPAYRLDVVHGGATGIRSQSSAGFSVIDIDAFNGDAALRFQKLGSTKWNVRNEPVNNDFQILRNNNVPANVTISNATGYVGITQTAPAYQLDVLHAGSTGIRSQSSASFSVVDIDAFSGDAALRFQKAGVGQWNTRNRPADDYYEIFELGGGGSRFVIQDATGNVGIGATVAPAYKLDVEHGGSTGIRSKSTASFSVVDIDAASGDAALRFAKAGVNQWNIRNRPADDYLEIFELGGGGSRMVIQDATGNVGIGATVAPAYRLDVEHGGSTGIRSKSTASFSVVDIDGNSGDAALRFIRAGVNKWNTRNEPTFDDYQIFELGGGGERMRIQRGTGFVGINTSAPSTQLQVVGTITGTVKAFTIDHPLDPANKTLRHISMESPEALDVYSGNIVTDAAGKAVVDLPSYFEALNKDFRYQLTVIGAFAQAIISKEIVNNKFEIATNQPNVKVSWQVQGVRNDPYMKNVFDLKMEEDKPASIKGKYYHPEAYGLPKSMGVNNTDTKGTSTEDIQPAVRNNVAPSSTGGSLDPVVAPAVKTAPASTGGSLDPVVAPKAVAAPASKGGSASDVAPAALPKAPAKPVENGGKDK